MMTEEQHIEWLLELQEHPEQLTDEQLRQILADDEMRQLVQQLGFAKRAFKHDALKNDTPEPSSTTRLKTTPQMWRANGRSLQPAIQKSWQSSTKENISPVFALTSHLARLQHLLSVYF